MTPRAGCRAHFDVVGNLLLVLLISMTIQCSWRKAANQAAFLLDENGMKATGSLRCRLPSMGRTWGPPLQLNKGTTVAISPFH